APAWAWGSTSRGRWPNARADGWSWPRARAAAFARRCSFPCRAEPRQLALRRPSNRGASSGSSSRRADQPVDRAGAGLGRFLTAIVRAAVGLGGLAAAVAQQRLVLRRLAGGAVAAGRGVELDAGLGLFRFVELQFADTAARIEIRDRVGVLLDVHGRPLAQGAARAAMGWRGNRRSLGIRWAVMVRRRCHRLRGATAVRG